MKLYSQWLFPWLCDLALRGPAVAQLRRELLAHARGDVLEIGFGTGLNLTCYPHKVRKVTAVDPNPGMHRLARRRIQQTGVEVEQRVLRGERLPFENDAFDCVVSTFTLCSIEHVNQALAEVQRVLKPAGKFLFLEHGLSPEANVRKWQRRLNWLQTKLANGCHLDRNMKELVAAQPFSAVDADEFYLKGMPRTHGYLWRGIATK